MDKQPEESLLGRPPQWLRTIGFWTAFVAGLCELDRYKKTGDSDYVLFAAAMFVCMAINNYDFDQKPSAE